MEKEALDLSCQVRQSGIQRFAPWIDDDGPLGVQPIDVAADGFTHTPLDAVAHHGVAEGARNRETDARSVRLRLADAESREERARDTVSRIVYPSKVDGSQQTNTFRKTRDGYYLSELTVSFFRPRARRRANTARPFLVSMRLRNPCVLAR